MRLASVLLVFSSLLCMAEIVDRIAITVGHQVITESQLDEELRVTAFLNHQPIVRDSKARRAAADRLIQQLLIEREMRLSRYALVDNADVDKYFEQVRSGFKSPSQFDEALRAYDVTAAVLRDHLGVQLATLRFIEDRFRPELGISDSDIQAAYKLEIQNWPASHPGEPPPTLAQLRPKIRRALLEKGIDRSLDNWLQESRRQREIVYLDKSLQ